MPKPHRRSIVAPMAQAQNPIEPNQQLQIARPMVRTKKKSDLSK